MKTPDQRRCEHVLQSQGAESVLVPDELHQLTTVVLQRECLFATMFVRHCTVM